MRILVLGASGGCGRWVTQLAAGHGHDVTALVRSTTPFEPPHGVSVRRGDALDSDDLARAAEAHDAIISCIGPQRANPRNPWSPLRPPLHCAELSARAIVMAHERSGVGRVAVISAAGVGDSFDALNPMMQWLIRRSTIGAGYADLDGMEKVLRYSRLDWVAVRPVTLVNAGPTSRTKELTRFRSVSIVGRADVAGWLLRATVDSNAISVRTPMIGWW